MYMKHKKYFIESGKLCVNTQKLQQMVDRIMIINKGIAAINKISDIFEDHFQLLRLYSKFI